MMLRRTHVLSFICHWDPWGLWTLMECAWLGVQGQFYFTKMHFINKEHCPPLSFFRCCWKALVANILPWSLVKSHSNLFSLILGPRQGQSFSSHICLCVPLSFKATYSNCSYRRTGMERTYQWGLGSLGDIVVGDEGYTTQSRRKFWVFSILLHINRYIYPWFKAIVDHYLE